MKLRLGLVSIGLTLLLACCATATGQTETKTAPTATAAQAEAIPAPDAVTAASKPFYDKPNVWKKDDLLFALRNHLKWSSDIFWAMATVNSRGIPDISAIMPYALRDDVLIFANRTSVARTNAETTGISDAIFRSVDPSTIDPKRYDYFGVVGNRLFLQIIDDPEELDELWEEYKALGAPISPAVFEKEDHFYMRIISIEPIG
ncbi:MAG: hypothetical protein GY762_20185 [Proteobacteria bacterium]|nr:hypothetical protein [Pseudomonadota bacterium]